jgi:hypothetical protein
MSRTGRSRFYSLFMLVPRGWNSADEGGVHPTRLGLYSFSDFVCLAVDALQHPEHGHITRVMDATEDV